MINKDDQFWHDLNEREEEWSYEKMEFDKKAHYYDGFDNGFAKGLSEIKTESVKKYNKIL